MTLTEKLLGKYAKKKKRVVPDKEKATKGDTAWLDTLTSGPDQTHCFANGIAFEATVAEVKKMFKKCGELVGFHMPAPKVDGKGRFNEVKTRTEHCGKAVLMFRTVYGLRAALALNNTLLKGCCAMMALFVTFLRTIIDREQISQNFERIQPDAKQTRGKEAQIARIGGCQRTTHPTRHRRRQQRSTGQRATGSQGLDRKSHEASELQACTRGCQSSGEPQQKTKASGGAGSASLGAPRRIHVNVNSIQEDSRRDAF